MSNYYRDLHIAGDPILTAIEDLQRDVEDLKREVYYNGHRNYLLCGDSYGDSLMPSSWADVFAGIVGEENAVNICASGGSFHSIIPEYSYYTAIQTYTESITAEERAKFTDIILLGGYNDAVSGNEAVDPDLVIAGGADWVEYVRDKYPAARITIGFIGATVLSKWWAALRSAKSSYMTIAKNNDVRYAHNIEYTMHDYREFDADYIHPTLTANSRIANNLWQVINTGSCDVYMDEELTVDTTAAATLGNFTSKNKIQSNINNGVATFRIIAVNDGTGIRCWNSFNFTTPVAFSANIGKVIAQFEKTVIMGSTTTFTTAIPCMIGVTVSGTTTYKPACVTVDGQSLMVHLAESVSNVSSLLLPPITVVEQSDYL